MTPPFVTVAMPSFNEERYIEVCLRSVLGQDYPADRLEVLVADGRSTDRTREIVTRIAADDARVVLVDNSQRLQAAGMNEAIRRARGDVIVRMDVHCEYAPDYVRRCVEVLERTGADNVGGAQRPRAETTFQRALCAALASPLGVGGASYRSAENEGWVDTVFLGAFRRRVFETVGLYDPVAFTNEDAELNQRIHDAGGKVYLSRDIVVHYHPRGSFGALARQYFRYGRGRARTLVKHGRFLSIRPAIPAGLVLVGAALLATSWAQPLTPVAAAAYAGLTGIEAVRVGRHAGVARIPTVWAIFPVLHVSHGVGFLAGLAEFLGRPDWSEPERLPAREREVAAVSR
ncbi:MAG TPA: glycosyltransferase family 2 protein [Haliangiales bacterium]|nr:glycosyltransferase family 2 protein [Haliangiales bacterium]